MRSDHVSAPFERYSPLDFHSYFVLSTINDEPRFVKEVVNFEEGKLWNKSMIEEMKALDKNEAWYLVEFPYGRKHVGSKWVFQEETKYGRKS